MSLMNYSGLATKVRAMESRLITRDQLQHMATLDTVPECADFLRQLPSYTEFFQSSDDADLHRGNIERQLMLSLYRDFAKLYRFSNPKQRTYLDFYFMHLELIIIKRCLRNCMAHNQEELHLALFEEFFNRHSKVDIMKLSMCEDLTDFIQELSGTVYYDQLKPIYETGEAKLFDCEMALDLLYFTSVWKGKNKYLSKKEQNILSETFGERIDMLNIQWIYRAKKYYQLLPADMNKLLIPINYKLKPQQMEDMVMAPTLDEFITIVQQTSYGRNSYYKDLVDLTTLDELQQSVLDRVYTMTAQKSPYSAACLNSYFYFKEKRIQQIITVIEGIRYQVPATELHNMIAGN